MKQLLSASCVLALAIGLASVVFERTEAQTGGVPNFDWDPLFFQDLPNRWTTGQVGGISVDKQDHIWIAHRPAYAATAIGAEPLDLARKLEKAAGIRGPRLILSLAPCPTGWQFDPSLSVEVGRLAVRSGVWPLKEYVEGRVVHTKVSRPRVPVEEYLKLQGRFRHLFEPERNEALLAGIQARVDAYWGALGE